MPPTVNIVLPESVQLYAQPQGNAKCYRLLALPAVYVFIQLTREIHATTTTLAPKQILVYQAHVLDLI